MNFPSRLQLSPEWGAVESVASALLAQGFKAYLAGGSVRDTLLGETPKDFDLVTDATEDQLRQLFPKSYSVGKSFGVLIVPLHGTNLEVAQFRKEGSYLDGRHPQSWQRATPEEDAQRRDFTVNALFYDLKTEQVIDHVGGLQDLQAKILRCVGNPQVRLAEDRLRLFRAVRLAAQLGFQMEFATEAALRKSAQEVFKVSAERKKEEFLKLLGSRRPHVGLQWMAELNWLSAKVPKAFAAFFIAPLTSLPRRHFMIWATSLLSCPWPIAMNWVGGPLQKAFRQGSNGWGWVAVTITAMPMARVFWMSMKTPNLSSLTWMPTWMCAL